MLKILCKILRTQEVEVDNPVVDILTNGATFQINNAKLYVPVVTLPTNHNIKTLENTNEGFKKNNQFHGTNVDLK